MPVIKIDGDGSEGLIDYFDWQPCGTTHTHTHTHTHEFIFALNH